MSLRHHLSRTRPLRTALTAAAAALALAGCTVAPTTPPTIPVSSPTTESPTPTPTTPTLTTTTPTASAIVSPTLGQVITPSASPTGPGVSTSGATTPSLIAVNPGTTVVLGLDNAFHHDGWVAGSYQPAAAASKVPALASTVNCGETGPALEFRLLPTSGTVRITAAQDLMSDSSDNTLTVQLIADGKVVGEKPLAFKETAEMTAPLSGVTVLKIVSTAKTPCRTSSVALITRALIQA